MMQLGGHGVDATATHNAISQSDNMGTSSMHGVQAPRRSTAYLAASDGGSIRCRPHAQQHSSDAVHRGDCAAIHAHLVVRARGQCAGSSVAGSEEACTTQSNSPEVPVTSAQLSAALKSTHPNPSCASGQPSLQACTRCDVRSPPAHPESWEPPVCRRSGAAIGSLRGQRGVGTWAQLTFLFAVNGLRSDRFCCLQACRCPACTCTRSTGRALQDTPLQWPEGIMPRSRAHRRTPKVVLLQDGVRPQHRPRALRDERSVLVQLRAVLPLLRLACRGEGSRGEG